MSDPLSVAGSAVGVLSLGLHVCGKIVSYTQALRGQNDDIQHLASRAEHVCSSLKNLGELIEETRDDSPGFASDLEAKALGLQALVKKLDAKVEQYKAVVTESMNGKARSTLKKAIYPFRKEALFEIGSCLDSMQATLRTELAISTARNINKVELKQDRILGEVKTLQVSLTNHSIRTVLQQPPSSIKELCDQLSDENWLASIHQAQGRHHTKQAKRRFSYYNRWLGLLVSGTFSLPIGPGGSSIAPFLRFSTVVGSNSWLGNIYARNFSLNTSVNTQGVQKRDRIWDNIDEFIQQSQYAFSVGEAAPTDLLEPFDISRNYFKLKGPITIILLPFLKYQPLHKDSPNVIKFISYMLSCGATVDYTSSSQILSMLCSSYILTEAELTLIPRMIESAGPINWPPGSWIEKQNMQEILRRNQDYIDLPNIYKAILGESCEDLQKIVQSKILGLPEKGTHGVSLLQSAMGWPEGVRMVLELGEGSNKPSPVPIIYHRRGCEGITDEDKGIDKYAESCSILLDAGFIIFVQDIPFTSANKLKAVFINEIAKRRKRLLEIATTHIHPNELLELRGGENGLPDTHASKLADALIARGVKLDHHLRPGDCESLYHSGYALTYHSFEIIEMIYNVGFTDIDLSLPRIYPPMVTLCALVRSDIGLFSPIKCIGWMISKGANPLQRLFGSNMTFIHALSGSLAVAFFRDSVYDRSNTLHKLHHLQSIEHWLFSLSINDSCSCPCSVDGCTPLTAALKELMTFIYKIEKFEETSPTRPSFRAFLRKPFQRTIQFLVDYNNSDSQVCHAIIRSLTFQALGLRHTCCPEIHYSSPQESIEDHRDIQEIADEQKHCQKHLDNLVAELQAQFDRDGFPLMDFLQGGWHDRIIAFLSYRDPFNEEYHEGVQRLGVFLEEEDFEIPLVVQHL